MHPLAEGMEREIASFRQKGLRAIFLMHEEAFGEAYPACRRLRIIVAHPYEGPIDHVLACNAAQLCQSIRL